MFDATISRSHYAPYVPTCCSSDDYDAMFTTKGAASARKKLHRKGLTGTAGDLASTVRASGISINSILEVGGGLGEIHVTLLEEGNGTSAVNVDLATSWEAEAGRLIADRGLEGKVERVVGDFVQMAPDLASADVVILHRVVCCYPDWKALLSAATSKANCLIALTFPVDRWRTRRMVNLGNLLNRLRKEPFRAFVHSEDAMLAFAQARGFEISSDQSGFVWRTVTAQR